MIIIYMYIVLYRLHHKPKFHCEVSSYLRLKSLAIVIGKDLLDHNKATIVAMPKTRHAKAYVTPFLIQA